MKKVLEYNPLSKEEHEEREKEKKDKLIKMISDH
jgi:hypothetical protein